MYYDKRVSNTLFFMSPTTAPPPTTTTPPIIAIINSINSADPQKNLARAIIAMQTIANPSPSTAAIPSITPGAAPILPAYTSSTGARAFFGALDLTPVEDGVHFMADLQYSAKIFGKTLDVRASILPVAAAVMPVIKPTATPVAVTTAPKNMEQYLYDQAMAISTTKLDFVANQTTGFTFIRITGKFTQILTELLADDNGGQGGGE